MKSNYGVREVRPRKRRIWWVLLVLLAAAAIVGYQTQYKPRAKVKNYASYATIVLAGVEIRLQEFEAGDDTARVKTLASLPRLWDKFCEIDCPVNDRTVEIQWKMAKIFEYTRVFMTESSAGKYIGIEKIETARVIEERIADLQWLINDTIAYGNFKRMR
jgi:hypothetical protein